MFILWNWDFRVEGIKEFDVVGVLLLSVVFSGLLYLPRVTLTPPRWLLLPLLDDIMRQFKMFSVTEHIPIEAIWIEYLALLRWWLSMAQPGKALIAVCPLAADKLSRKRISCTHCTEWFIGFKCRGLKCGVKPCKSGFQIVKLKWITVQANDAIYMVIWRGLFNVSLAPNKVSALLDAKDGQVQFLVFLLGEEPLSWRYYLAPLDFGFNFLLNGFFREL